MVTGIELSRKIKEAKTRYRQFAIMLDGGRKVCLFDLLKRVEKLLSFASDTIRLLA